MLVKIEKRGGGSELMELEEFSRWMCFAEATIYIENKAKDLKMDYRTLKRHDAIDDYIKERFPSMLHDVTQELKLGLL